MKKYIKPEIKLASIALENCILAGSTSVGIGEGPATGPALSKGNNFFGEEDDEEDQEDDADADEEDDDGDSYEDDARNRVVSPAAGSKPAPRKPKNFMVGGDEDDMEYGFLRPKEK